MRGPDGSRELPVPPPCVCTLGLKHPPFPQIIPCTTSFPRRESPPTLLGVLRAGGCFLGWFRVLWVVFSILLPLPLGFICVSHVDFGTTGEVFAH